MRMCSMCSMCLMGSFAVLAAACSAQPVSRAEVGNANPSDLSVCLRSLTGTFSSRGLDELGGKSIFYYEVAALPRANAAESLKVSIDTVENRLELRQLSVAGSDVVAPSRIRGRCEAGAWVNAFDGEMSADGTRVRVTGQASFAIRDGNLVVRYQKREESRSGVTAHDRVGLFPRL
jgi:hypothetical protein